MTVVRGLLILFPICNTYNVLKKKKSVSFSGLLLKEANCFPLDLEKKKKIVLLQCFHPFINEGLVTVAFMTI